MGNLGTNAQRERARYMEMEGEQETYFSKQRNVKDLWILLEAKGDKDTLFIRC